MVYSPKHRKKLIEALANCQLSLTGHVAPAWPRGTPALPPPDYQRDALIAELNAKTDEQLEDDMRQCNEETERRKQDADNEKRRLKKILYGHQSSPPPVVATAFIDSTRKFVPVGEIAAITARAIHPKGGIEWAATLQYHKQELDAAIRRQEIRGFEPATHRALGEQLDRLPVEGSPLANAAVPTEDVQKFAASVGVKVILDFAEIEYPFSPEIRQMIAGQEHWSERELEALCLGVPPAIYSDDSAPEAERVAIRKAIYAACNNGKLHAERTGTGNALYHGQWRIERVSAVRWALGFPKFPDWLARYDLKVIWARQDAERCAMGRCTLNEAAAMISEGADERADGMLKKLMQAVRDGTLPVYEPGKLARYKPDTVREYYEEAYWNDLNAWLITGEPRIKYRFRNPNSSPIAPTLASKAQADEVIDWYNTTLGAATWWSLNSITPREAAMQLCLLNPHDDTTDPLTTTSNETGPDDFKRLVRVFEDIAQADAQARTLKQWRDIAKARGLNYHSWIDEYDQAIGLTDKQEEGGNAGEWKTTCHLGKVATPPAKAQPEAEARKQSAPPAGETTTHTVGNTRTHALSAVIAIAKKTAPDAADYHSVWAALMKLAESKDRPAPLLEHKQIEVDGIKYQAEKKVKFFTKNALRNMMRRAAANAR